jgi:hypothetical protein
MDDQDYSDRIRALDQAINEALATEGLAHWQAHGSFKRNYWGRIEASTPHRGEVVFHAGDEEEERQLSEPVRVYQIIKRVFGENQD